MTTKPIRLAVLLSGGGTTLQNIINRIAGGSLSASVDVVVSSKPGVKGLERAEKAGIPNHTVNFKEHKGFKLLSDAVNNILAQYDFDLICLAGYMHLYHFPEAYKGKVLNIHPALIPSFCGRGYYGHHVHEAVAAAGVKVSGCTVHIVDEEYDHGPIVVQKTVPVFAEDTPDEIAKKVFEAECEAYPEAITLFAENRIEVNGQIVKILPKTGTAKG